MMHMRHRASVTRPPPTGPHVSGIPRFTGPFVGIGSTFATRSFGSPIVTLLYQIQPDTLTRSGPMGGGTSCLKGGSLGTKTYYIDQTRVSPTERATLEDEILAYNLLSPTRGGFNCDSIRHQLAVPKTSRINQDVSIRPASSDLRPRWKIPRSARGMVKTTWRWGTSSRMASTTCK